MPWGVGACFRQSDAGRSRGAPGISFAVRTPETIEEPDGRRYWRYAELDGGALVSGDLEILRRIDRTGVAVADALDDVDLERAWALASADIVVAHNVRADDAGSRIGFCASWCGNCHHGHVLSRVRVPSSIDFLSLDADDDVLQAAIPEFRDAVSVDLGPADLAPEAALAPLSPREAEVLELMCEGLRVQAIAERLIISPATVYTLRQRISLKLGRPITELAVR